MEDFGDDDDLELGPEVAEALAKGTDLRQYSAEIETALRSVERASIQDYLQESESLAGLHTEARPSSHPLAHPTSCYGALAT